MCRDIFVLFNEKHKKHSYIFIYYYLRRRKKWYLKQKAYRTYYHQHKIAIVQSIAECVKYGPDFTLKMEKKFKMYDCNSKFLAREIRCS